MGFEAQEQTSTSVIESHPLCDILHLINTHIYEVYMYQRSIYILLNFIIYIQCYGYHILNKINKNV